MIGQTVRSRLAVFFPERKHNPTLSMQCERLVRLAKSWYLHVKGETMAPARMMQFIDKHVRECPICQQDAGLPSEVEKIRDFILPESRAPKALKPIQGTIAPEHRVALPDAADEVDDDLDDGQDLDEELSDTDDEEAVDEVDDEV